MNKKLIPLIGIAIVILAIVIGGGVLALSQQNNKPDENIVEEPKKKRARARENVIELSQRPYVLVSPQGNHNVIIEIKSVNKDAQSVEYELEYQAGSLLQGAFGNIELNNLPVSEDILLGSCSAGGACTYHQEVKGGSLLFEFQGDENYVLKQDWKYIENTARESAHSSRDAKFQIDSPALEKQALIIIYNTPGYPAGLEGKPVSEPYVLQTAGNLTGKGKLTMRASEEGELVIMGYDGAKWQEFDTTVEGKTATAEVELLESYIVVKKDSDPQETKITPETETEETTQENSLTQETE